jgi:hypothetical protein
LIFRISERISSGPILQIRILLYQHVKQFADLHAKAVFSFLFIFNDKIGVSLHENKLFHKIKRLIQKAE